MGIDLSRYMYGHQTTAPKEHVDEATKLLGIISALEKELGLTFRMTSGYRTPEHNKSIGGSPNSAHCKGMAIDIADADGFIKMKMRAEDFSLLKKFGLYMEDGSVATTWIHLTTRAPRSNKREFMP